MASLKNFLKKAPRGKTTTGMKGKESGWLRLATFDLKGKRFLISDAGHMGSEEDGLSVRAKPGSYNVEVKVMEFGKDRRISRLRVKLAGIDKANLKKVGDTWADVGRVAFSDADVLLKLGTKLESDEIIDLLNESLSENEEIFGKHQFGEGGPEMIYTDSGFGDGTFPVFQLKSKNDAVGFEVEFIAPDASYPFGGSDKPTIIAAAVVEKADDSVMQAIGQLLSEMKQSRTGDPEKDRAKFKELADKQLATMWADIEKEIAEYRKTRISLRREAEPWTDSFEPKLAIAIANRNESLREQMMLAVDQVLFNWPRTLGDKCPVDLDEPEVIKHLVIVFEGEEPSELAMKWWCATGDYLMREEQFNKGDSIRSFSNVNKSKKFPLELVCRKQAGLKAEYFLTQPLYKQFCSR